MDQSHSWDADSSSAAQEFSCLLFNCKIHYHTHTQEPAAEPYPQPAEYSTYPHSFQVFSIYLHNQNFMCSTVLI